MRCLYVCTLASRTPLAWLILQGYRSRRRSISRVAAEQYTLSATGQWREVSGGARCLQRRLEGLKTGEMVAVDMAEEAGEGRGPRGISAEEVDWVGNSVSNELHDMDVPKRVAGTG